MSNVITVVGGGLGRDAEFKTTSNGTNVCEISVADKVYDGKENKTQWYRVALFGVSPDKYPGNKLRKGARIDITGELSEREFTDKGGNTRTTLELRNARIISVFLRDDDGGQQRASNNKPGASTGAGFVDDSIPF